MIDIVIDANPIMSGYRAVSRCSANIANELINQHTINCHFLCFNPKRNKINNIPLLSYGVKKKIVPLPYRILIPLWKRLSFPKMEMIINGCDILYTNEFYFPPTKKTLVVATIHGLAYKVIPEKIAPKIVKSLNQGLGFILKHADYLIAVSETSKKELINRIGVPANRIYVVTHGVDKIFKKNENLKSVKGHLKKQFGLNRPYILYVGAVGIHKNVMGILSAYYKISDKKSHDLVIAGSPDSAWDAAIQFVNDCGLSRKVHFLGHVHRTEDLSNIYNGAELFVFPSFYEGWTSPPLEAMACGTPVITSTCSSLPETVGNAAILIDPDNIEALAFAMNRVLSNNNLQIELIEKGLVHVSSHTWEKAGKKMVEVFKDVMDRGPWKHR